MLSDSIGGAMVCDWQFFGGIDILVNNAGAVIGSKNILDLDGDSWDKIFHLNARALYFASGLRADNFLVRSYDFFIMLVNIQKRGIWTFV